MVQNTAGVVFAELRSRRIPASNCSSWTQKQLARISCSHQGKDLGSAQRFRLPLPIDSTAIADAALQEREGKNAARTFYLSFQLGAFQVAVAVITSCRRKPSSASWKKTARVLPVDKYTLSA